MESCSVNSQGPTIDVSTFVEPPYLSASKSNHDRPLSSSLLADPNPRSCSPFHSPHAFVLTQSHITTDDPLVPEIAQLFIKSRVEHDKRAREWTGEWLSRISGESNSELRKADSRFHLNYIHSQVCDAQQEEFTKLGGRGFKEAYGGHHP